MDRNHTNVLPSVEVKPSLSARRAWIEIRKSAVQEKYRCVALRKESVDRNWQATANITQGKKSLSARRAWIEIQMTGDIALRPSVALRKESVDRNVGA